jgi:hypothetical protein
MSQTTITQKTAKAAPGLLADIKENDIIGRLIDVTAGVPFGRFMKLKGEGQCELPSSAAHITGGLRGGVTIRDLAREQSQAGVTQYNNKDAASLLRSGRIWVQVEEAVVVGDPVFVRHAGGPLGAFRKDADVSAMVDQATAIPNAKYLSAAAENGLALIEFDLR